GHEKSAVGTAFVAPLGYLQLRVARVGVAVSSFGGSFGLVARVIAVISAAGTSMTGCTDKRPVFAVHDCNNDRSDEPLPAVGCVGVALFCRPPTVWQGGRFDVSARL